MNSELHPQSEFKPDCQWKIGVAYGYEEIYTSHTHTRTHGRTRAAVTGGEREEGGGLHQRDEFTDCCVPASPLSCTSGLTTRYVTLCSGVCHRVLHTKHHLSPLAATEVCTQALCQTSFLDSFNTQSVSVLTPQTLDCFRGNAEKPLADGVERMWAFPSG